MKRFAKFTALLLPFALASHAPAISSSCVNPKTVQIKFAKGANCWTYSGTATHVSGRFAKGQKVLATSTGIALFGDGERDWKTTTQRDVSISGPGDFFADVDDSGGEPVTLPRTGDYTFDFSPCAMWGGLGTFVVCTM